MYMITITVNADVSEAQQAEMFPRHAAWFQQHFQAGHFLMLGPFTDTDLRQNRAVARRSVAAQSARHPTDTARPLRPTG